MSGGRCLPRECPTASFCYTRRCRSGYTLRSHSRHDTQLSRYGGYTLKTPIDHAIVCSGAAPPLSRLGLSLHLRAQRRATSPTRLSQTISMTDEPRAAPPRAPPPRARAAAATAASSAASTCTTALIAAASCTAASCAAASSAAASSAAASCTAASSAAASSAAASSARGRRDRRLQCHFHVHHRLDGRRLMHRRLVRRRLERCRFERCRPSWSDEAVATRTASAPPVGLGHTVKEPRLQRVQVQEDCSRI